MSVETATGAAPDVIAGTAGVVMIGQYLLGAGPKNRKNCRKSGIFRRETRKTRKKPVETALFPLTNALESRKVNGGRYFRTRVITGFYAMWTRNGKTCGERAKRLPEEVKTQGGRSMATTMTKTALVRQMAEKLELTNKQSAAFLDLLAETAIKETKKNGVFVIPGLGRLVKAERKARIGRNPQTGEQIKIKAKTVVKFRVAKSAKDSIAPSKK
jgi:DNA-binding protein HU-beta